MTAGAAPSNSDLSHYATPPSAVPLPATLGLLAAGALGGMLVQRRRRMTR